MGFGDVIVVESWCFMKMLESLKHHILLSCFVVISKGNIHPFYATSL